MFHADRAYRMVSDWAGCLASLRDASSFPFGRWDDVVRIWDVFEGHALRVEALCVANFKVVGYCAVHKWRESNPPLSGRFRYFAQTV